MNDTVTVCTNDCQIIERCFCVLRQIGQRSEMMDFAVVFAVSFDKAEFAHFTFGGSDRGFLCCNQGTISFANEMKNKLWPAFESRKACNMDVDIWSNRHSIISRLYKSGFDKGVRQFGTHYPEEVFATAVTGGKRPPLVIAI